MFRYVNTGLPTMVTCPYYMPPKSKSGLKGRVVHMPIIHPPTRSTVVYGVVGSVGRQFGFVPVLCNCRATCASGKFHAVTRSCTPVAQPLCCTKRLSKGNTKKQRRTQLKHRRASRTLKLKTRHQKTTKNWSEELTIDEHVNERRNNARTNTEYGYAPKLKTTKQMSMQ